MIIKDILTGKIIYILTGKIIYILTGRIIYILTGRIIEIAAHDPGFPQKYFNSIDICLLYKII